MAQIEEKRRRKEEQRLKQEKEDKEEEIRVAREREKLAREFEIEKEMQRRKEVKTGIEHYDLIFLVIDYNDTACRSARVLPCNYVY